MNGHKVYGGRNMDGLISRYMLYYPATLLKGELIYKHTRSYRNQQFMSQAQKITYAEMRLSNIIHFARKHSEFYKGRIPELDVKTSFRECIKTLPLLEKSDLIENLDSIATYKRRFSSAKTTGGSTGEPVKLYKNPDALARERVATWRSYGWAGISIGDSQARFWGIPHGSLNSYKARLIDFVSNRRRISAFDLAEKELKEHYKKIQRFKPTYLYGYVSAIEALTHYVEAEALPQVDSIRCIITTSEVLTESVRQHIEAIWGVKVFNEYGCGEVGSIAHECEHGRLHVMADNMYVELIDDAGQPASTGQIVVTDYFNEATPLIRYKVGDYATVSDEACPCGRTLPVLENVHGRAYDIIRTPSGRRIHPESVMYIFEGLQAKSQAFSQFQVVQEELHKFKINIVRTEKWSDHLVPSIEAGIHQRIHPDVSCEFAFCDAVPREASGKMRVVKSLLH
jgi:phenylacetate-CoA ligase